MVSLAGMATPADGNAKTKKTRYLASQILLLYIMKNQYEQEYLSSKRALPSKGFSEGK